VNNYNDVYYKPIYYQDEKFLIHESDNLKTFAKKHLKTLLLLSCTILLLANCSNTTTSAKKKSPAKHEQSQKKTPTDDSAHYYIEQAKQAQQQLQPTQAVDDLIIASRQLFAQQQFEQALWLANQLSPLVSNNIDRYQLSLIKAKSLFSLNQLPLAFAQITIADNYAKQATLTHQADYYQLLANIQQARGLIAESLIAQLHFFALNKQATKENTTQLWQQFSSLSQWQITQIAQAQPPYSKGWLALIRYANKYGDKTQQFRRYLINWRRQYNSHPANSIIAALLNKIDQRTTKTINNIAIILPLSGKQKTAGVAAQQGILAAYNNNSVANLYFIDSNNLDWNTLATTFSEQNIDHVIGPLLKSNVDNYLSLQELSTDTLLLNIPEKNSLRENYLAISMRPEDEAIQAADTLSRRHYQHPLIISDYDKVSKRITKNFIEQWQKNTNQAPEVFYLSNAGKGTQNGKKRQKNIQTSLDVEQSKARIKALKYRVKQSLKTETRNRRDVDMIYLVSNSQKTRLLKPYIDVSISPFAKLIPVFSSSRSHSAKADRQGTRDLSGLSFTEMPWLLSSKQQNKKLAELSKQLWSKRSDSLQGIFALGFDSLALIYKLPLMQQEPYIQHFGQTGTLKLNSNNILTRSLLWGQYKNNKVQAIAME